MYTGRPFEPYGITYDPGSNHIWLADKLNNKLWRLSISINRLNSSHVDAVAFNSPLVVEPCSIDYSPLYGLLIACYGSESCNGKLIRYFEGNWTSLAFEIADRFTHCCWLPRGGYCFITRSDTRLWIAEDIASRPEPFSMPTRSFGGPLSGELRELRLSYVQGLCYSISKNAVFIADPNLRKIFQVCLNEKTYFALEGKNGPLPGEFRGITGDLEKNIVWINGENGELFRITAWNEVESLGNGVENTADYGIVGVGMSMVK